VLAGDASRAYSLAEGSVVVGRSATSDVVLDDSSVAGAHLRLERSGGRVELHDLSAGAGTFVNGQQVMRTVLADGDVVLAGSTALRFSGGAPAEDAALVSWVGQASEPYLSVVEGGSAAHVDLVAESLVVGGAKGADVLVVDPRAEPRHALIERDGDGFFVRDLDTASGTFVHGRRIERHRLQHGDTIEIGEARLTFSDRVETSALEEEERSGSRRRPVVLVPGFMGSELWLGGERIWPNLRRLLLDPEVGKLPDAGAVTAPAILDELVIVPNVIELDTYGRLTRFLEESLGYRSEVDLLEFPYDWRQDCRESARRLAAAVDEWRARAPEANQPLTIVAHSLGCLVARYYVERLGGRDVVDRLILIGAPHRGSPRAISTLIEGPGIMPLERADQRVGEVLATFPSVYQLLPVDACVSNGGAPFNCLEDTSWLPEASHPLLREALSFHAELGSTSSVPVVSIFGYGVDTPTRYELRRDRDGETRVELLEAGGGDDTVPEANAIVPGSEIHPVEQHHGALFTDNDVKMRLKLELTRLP
jgi:pSer/pThr/pTyr-binding forkhead associated (FHA) protein